MDHDVPFEQQRRTSIVSSKQSFLNRAVTFRRGDVTDDNEKGPLGLTTIFQPAEGAIGDIVFVHGLGGGSRKTWSKNEDTNLFWPQQWLPQDPEFQDIRIQTFGYDANWDRESILNIHDFAKSLLYALKDCPSTPKEDQGPILLVCHSLGGLVAKRAYILSRQLKEYEDLGRRIRSIFFLATPHRGSDMAELLSRILQITPTISSRPFVNDLHPNSSTIQSINDEFPHHCQDLQLHSFYETKPMSFGYRKIVIVPKDSAVLGYENERSTYLTANHREVCKFSDVQDPNYQSVRNSLASTLATLRRTQTLERHEADFSEQQWLRECLDIDEAHEDDYQRIDMERISGSCTWLLDTSGFQAWLHYSSSQLYWLMAKPGAGKSVLSSFVISHLRQSNENNIFYFFTFGDKTRLSIGCLLRSIAWQLCLMHREVFNLVRKLCQQDPHLLKADYRSIWRKVFLEGIFRIELFKIQYLVIDAIDECKGDVDLVPLLVKAAELNTMRIFITSRNSFESYGVAYGPKLHVVAETIPNRSISADIRLYVTAHVNSLPALGEDKHAARNAMMESILDKSSGCFLWVRLVIDELRRVHTAEEVRIVLQEVPSDMDRLYMRILDSMSHLQYGKRLTQAILTWTSCAARPLSTDELHQALQIDMNDKIDSVERSIVSNCGQIVHVDTSSRVLMIHQTAREFLFHPQNASEFYIDRKEGQKRLALVCLKYLCGSEMTGPKPRKLSATITTQGRSPFVNYASTCLADHISHVSSEDDDLVPALARFFGSRNVLAWIEFIAANDDLECLIHTGRSLQKFLQRRQKHGLIPLGRDISILDAWATDLTRLVTKFGKNLTMHPSSIYTLIPPFCPSETALKRQFGMSNRSLLVTGLSSDTWDDCSSVITYPNQYPSSVSCSSTVFAVGLAKGDIMIHHAHTSLEIQTLSHGEAIKGLQFAESGSLLASLAFKSLCIWNTSSWQRVWKFELDSQCLDIKFLDNDKLLLVALKSNRLLLWNMATGDCQEFPSWLEGFDEDFSQHSHRPQVGTIAGNSAMLAVVYRGEDIIVWDIENDTIIDLLGQDVGSRGSRARRRSGVAFVRNMVFSRSSESGLLAASYNDGELIVFNTMTNEIQARTHANAHTLISSPDGLMLACGNSAGMILIFEFETLKLLYRSVSEGYGIKALAFSADSYRLTDIRGPFCRVWEPPILISVHQDKDEHNSDTISVSTAPQDYNLGNTEQTAHISAFVCVEECDVVLCGRYDGSISIFDGKTGEQYPEPVQKPNNASITALLFDYQSSTLISSDVNNRIVSYQVIREPMSWKATMLFLQRSKGVVTQMIANAGCSRVLVSTPELDTLYRFDLHGMSELESISWLGRRRCRWTMDPTNTNHLILITETVAHLHDWNSLHRLTSETGIRLSSSVLPELAVRSATPCFDGNVIATTFAESLASRSRSKLFLWNTSDFTSDSMTAEPIPHYQALADQVECLIGNFGHRLIFLHRDGWVCSADPHNFKVDLFDRHFFFPVDWLCAAGGLMLGIFRNGNIAFVQKNEVAIIRRGMEYSDTGQSRGVGKRPSLARSVKSDPSVSEAVSSLSLRNV